MRQEGALWNEGDGQVILYAKLHLQRCPQGQDASRVVPAFYFTRENIPSRNCAGARQDHERAAENIWKKPGHPVDLLW